MRKYIIFILLLFNSLSSFSVGNSLTGPTTVDPGTYYSYRANLDGWDINTVVRWKITNGRFNNVNGPTELRQTIGALLATVVWDDTTSKGTITVDINGPVLLRIEVNINSVKNMYITDFRFQIQWKQSYQRYYNTSAWTNRYIGMYSSGNGVPIKQK